MLGITADGRFYIESVLVAEQDMLRELQEVMERKFARVVLIKADQAAAYSDVMAVLDQLQRAGIEEIGLITERKIGGGGVGGGGE